MSDEVISTPDLLVLSWESENRSTHDNVYLYFFLSICSFVYERHRCIWSL